MPGRDALYVPGPTNVPDRILRAMHCAMADHRSPEFPALVRDILDRLPQILRTTTGRPFVFPATGSGMWEAALVNTVDPGSRLLATRYGQFSHLFIDAARRLGYVVDVLESEWGTAAPADRIEVALREDATHEIKGVLVAHNETSTGVTSDVAAVRRAIDAAGHPALLFVDGVSSIASLDFRMDEWGVDLAITGSQKGFMLPAGLGILGVSARAMSRVADCTAPRSYFDLRPMITNNDAGYFPYTPALSLLFGLQESITMLLDEGLDNVASRHRHLASGVRAAVAAWGLPLCAREPAQASNTVTAVMLPGGQAPALLQRAFHRYRLSLGAGLGEMSGKLFRIGHLGDLNELMLLGALGGVEMALTDVGVAITPGSGTAAAQAAFRAGVTG
jgi:alanine-glyoxylate transaminase / serine-glyoxylate transaminase / serine-pyruvate transaminase